jgi:autotransporter-associated beta strand protein
LNSDSLFKPQQPATTLELAGGISGPGGFTKTGPGTLSFTGSAPNTYAGITRVNEGVLSLAQSIHDSAVPGDLIIGDGVGGAEADIVREAAPHPQIGNTGTVTINSSGLLDLSTFSGGPLVSGVHDSIGSLAGSGHVNLGNKSLGAGENNTSTKFSGILSGGDGGFTKFGTGTLNLSGANTYSGPTEVATGTLLVNGSQPGSPVHVASGAILGGSGVVGHIAAEGKVAPGTSPGILTSSNVVLNSDATLAIELNGLVPGTSYDQMSVRGSVTFSNAALQLSTAGLVPSEGDRFLILDNDGSDPVVGTFNGLAESALVASGPLKFLISYQGGRGNDVTLTFTNTTIRVAARILSGGNGNDTLERNECCELSLCLTNASDVSMDGVVATLTPVTAGVAVLCGTTAYPDVPPGGCRTNLEPFQISAWPGLTGTTNVQLALYVQSATHGSFTLPILLPSDPAGDGGGVCESCPERIIYGLLSEASATQDQRLILNGRVSSCETNRLCPGEAGLGPRRYDAYTFVNGESNACITVLLTAKAALSSAAYLNSYTPANLCENYLADRGASTADALNQPYSFAVPAGARFVVVVNEVDSGTTAPYTLAVSGGSCRPALHVALAGAENVVLDWTTAAVGSQLERTPGWNPTQFQPVLPLPRVVAGRNVVTNAATDSAGFYRLHQP